MTSTALSRSSRGGLSKYDPQKGLKTVAVAEAAEKHYALAKDATQLIVAIEAKLTAQAEFVFWWDTTANKAPRGEHGKRKKQSDRSAALVHLGSDGLPNEHVVRRWRKKLNDPEDFERSKQLAIAKYPKLLEFETIDRQLKASNSNEWYTPTPYLEAARAVLGAIDLDPASSQKANVAVRATTFFSIEDDGLAKEWNGRVWLNPPYGGLSGPFTARLLDQFTAGKTTAAILLVNSNSTDAAWFQPLWDFLLCFTDHRINFIAQGGAESGSTHGSVFAYLGPERELFLKHFSLFGAVVERAA